MAHLSSPQAQRTLKFITGVACVGVGLNSVFFSKFEEIEGFEGKDHIFTNIQKDGREFIDRNIYGIDTSTIREAKRNHHNATTTAATKKSVASGSNSSSSNSSS